MEFNVLPRAKILSPASIHKSSQTTSQTVNVIMQPPQPKPPAPQPQPAPPAEPQTEQAPPPEHPIEYGQPSNGPNPYQAIDPAEVHYQTRDVKLEEPAEQLSKQDSIATINFLKLVLQAYMSNPIKYNGYIICSVPVLENMIETLTGCDNCDVQVPDVEPKCCNASTPKIVPVSKIWVRNGSTTQLFKYEYGQFLNVFEQYNISLKFAYLE